MSRKHGHLCAHRPQGIFRAHVDAPVADGSIRSREGQLVAFVSRSTNLVPNDTNGRQDVFVKDLLSGLDVQDTTYAPASGVGTSFTTPA